MRIVHESADGGRTVLASNVEHADSFETQTLGLMFRESLPEEYALVFEFENPLSGVASALPTGDRLRRLAEWLPVGGRLVRALRLFLFEDAAYRAIHMLFVRMPLDVVWLDDGEVVKVRTMQPWRSATLTWCDAVVELPEGAAADVEIGDRLRFEDGADSTLVDRSDGRARPHSRRWRRGRYGLRLTGGDTGSGRWQG